MELSGQELGLSMTGPSNTPACSSSLDLGPSLPLGSRWSPEDACNSDNSKAEPWGTAAR